MVANLHKLFRRKQNIIAAGEEGNVCLVAAASVACVASKLAAVAAALFCANDDVDFGSARLGRRRAAPSASSAPILMPTRVILARSLQRRNWAPLQIGTSSLSALNCDARCEWARRVRMRSATARDCCRRATGTAQVVAAAANCCRARTQTALKGPSSSSRRDSYGGPRHLGPSLFSAIVCAFVARIQLRVCCASSSRRRKRRRRPKTRRPT